MIDVNKLRMFNPIQNEIRDKENAYRLKKACQAFEALFIAELLTEMEKTIPKDPLVKNNAENSIYRFMYINALSQKISSDSPFSIATTLFNSLKQYLSYKSKIPAKLNNNPMKLQYQTKFKPIKQNKFKPIKHDKNKMEFIEKTVREASKEYHIPEKLILSIIKTESSFNPMAVSKAGAVGLMQLMPQTALAMGVKNVWDIRQNIMGGVKYLSKLIKEFKDYKKALAAYNAGPANVKKYNGIPPFKETQNYVRKVLAYANSKY